MLGLSWVTVAWSMIASACLALALIYFLVWCRNRSAWPQLLFAVTAGSTAVFTFFELWLMRVTTVEEFLTAATWAHVPLFFWLVSTTWFVHFRLRAGRLWLAWTVTGLRAFCLLLNFVVHQNLNFRDVTGLRHIPFLGESVTVPDAVTNPWMLIGHLSMLLLLAFVADASVTAWRRGDRRQALIGGGSVELFLLLGLVETVLIFWGNLTFPILYSPLYLCLVAVMGYELSGDVLRASQLVRDLQASEVRLHNLNGRLLSAQEEERQRIARELHDSVCQQMALLSIEIEEIAMQHIDTSAVADSLRRLGNRSAEITSELHGMSHRLHSAKLQALGLAAAVRGHCKEVGVYGLQVRFSEVRPPDVLSPDVALCLFRIVQEGLSNIVKHSGADEANVMLLGTDDAIAVRVIDLGRGFDDSAPLDRAGLGLASMRERMRLVGGQLTITSRPGHGTTIEARVPLGH